MKYLGLELDNPIIVASSPLTGSVERIARLAEAGAGAVVLKSVFEEQIGNQTAAGQNYYDSPEAADYLYEYVGEEYLDSHLDLIRGARREVGIPVIASINCIGAGTWIDFARRIEDAGADALQLNIALLPTSADKTATETERHYLDIIAAVTENVSLPVTVKLGARFTNIINLCREIYYRGAKGVTLFNRFYEPDIETDTMTFVASDSLSEHSELRNALRWIAMTSAQVDALDIAAATGVHTGDDVVKALLAGARAVEVCTAIYRDGVEVIGAMKRDLSAWMAAHSFDSTDEFRGRLNAKSIDIADREAFERVQYMKFFPR